MKIKRLKNYDCRISDRSLKVLPVFMFLSFFFSIQLSHAQTREDIKTVSNLITVPQYREHYATYKGDKKIVQIVSRALFGFYKNYISSQDGSHCSFTPSCSEYALQSIKKKGLFIGLLSAFDRLSRCNGLNNDKYPIKKGSNLLYDPVD